MPADASIDRSIAKKNRSTYCLFLVLKQPHEWRRRNCITKHLFLAHFWKKDTICPLLILVYNACKRQHWKIHCQKNRSIFCLFLVLKQPHEWWLSVYSSHQDPRLLWNTINRLFPTLQSVDSVKMPNFTANSHALIPWFPQNIFFNTILLEGLMCVWGGGDVGVGGCYLSMSVCVGGGDRGAEVMCLGVLGDGVSYSSLLYRIRLVLCITSLQRLLTRALIDPLQKRIFRLFVCFWS